MAAIPPSFRRAFATLPMFLSVSGSPAARTASRITSPITTTGIPIPAAIRENSPLPLAGNPTTPITLIDHLPRVCGPYRDGPPDL